MRRFLLVLTLLALTILVWPSTASAGVCTQGPLIGHGAILERLHLVYIGSVVYCLAALAMAKAWEGTA